VSDFLQGLAARINRHNAKPTPVARVWAEPVKAEASEFMRFGDAARFAQVSKPTLAAWEKVGLKVYRPSKRVALVRRSELEAFIVGGAS
jgi:hypothetical protein